MTYFYSHSKPLPIWQLSRLTWRKKIPPLCSSAFLCITHGRQQGTLKRQHHHETWISKLAVKLDSLKEKSSHTFALPLVSVSHPHTYSCQWGALNWSGLDSLKPCTHAGCQVGSPPPTLHLLLALSLFSACAHWSTTRCSKATGKKKISIFIIVVWFLFSLYCISWHFLWIIHKTEGGSSTVL